MLMCGAFVIGGRKRKKLVNGGRNHVEKKEKFQKTLVGNLSMNLSRAKSLNGFTIAVKKNKSFLHAHQEKSKNHI